MKALTSLVLSTLALTACGTHETSELAGSQKYRITCDIRVNQWTPGQGSLLATVDTHVDGKKTYKDIEVARADDAEIRAVSAAADQKCSTGNATKINTAACSQVAANVNAGNLGRYNTFNINNGQSTGFYQCQTALVVR